MAGKKRHPVLSELFLTFFRISFITIGGGYVMFPLLKHEVVDAKGWLTDEEMVDYYALGQSIPGIIAMNTSTLIGYRKRGIPGAAAAAAGMALPSLIVILLVSVFLLEFFEHPWVQKAFSGIRCAVVALMVTAVWKVGARSVNSPLQIAIAVIAFAAIAGCQAHPVLIIAAGGVLGFVLLRKVKEGDSSEPPKGSAADRAAPRPPSRGAA
ncbi:MAG TPA: chromate transporter [Pontiella sp.]